MCAPYYTTPIISCQRKYFRLAICILDFICKIVSRASFILKNDFHFEIQGTSTIFILIFSLPANFHSYSHFYLSLGAKCYKIKAYIGHMYTMNAGNILWARLDKSPSLYYNIKKTDFLSDTTSLKYRISDTVYSYFLAQIE